MKVAREIKHIIDQSTGCWNCISHKPDRYGYPRRGTTNGQEPKIFRMMYMQYKGEIPQGMVVRHTCDNRRCINPNHLIIGTNLDNVRDSIERGRHVSCDKNRIRIGKPQKLTTKDIIEIRESTAGTSEIARQYNIGRHSVWEIRKRITWKHI